jgi:hypothetical protein
MEKRDFSEMTTEELLPEKKKLKKCKITHALLIGFLAGILIFGFTAWVLNPDRRLGFFIPMFLPGLFIYKMIKNSKNNADLEAVLKERGLS